MKRAFADSFYFIALINPAEGAHRRAVEATRQRIGELVTTQWVLVEVADAFSAPAWRPKFLETRVTDALTGDIHFRQAGFSALLSES